MHHDGVGHRQAARLDAVEEIADVAHGPLGAGHVVADEFVEVGEPGGVRDVGPRIAVGDRDPAFGAFVADATGAVPAAGGSLPAFAMRIIRIPFSKRVTMPSPLSLGTY